jgi:serine/threonine protein kinase
MQTLSALSVESECPHIVRYFNSWIEDDRIHIVMELCEKSLSQVRNEAKASLKRLRNEDRHLGFIPEEELRKIIRDILLGLNELHKQGIVHLDIKPGNILLGKNKNYKLGDLGMARFLTKITEDNNIPEGDCRYLAKELLSRDVLAYIPDLKKCDIFSLGITAYELITLQDLEKNGPEWRSLRNGTFEYPKEIQDLYSPEILETIRHMLEEHTDDRPSADELLSTVFKSAEQRRIDHLQRENEKLLSNQYKLFEFLRQNGVDV